MRLTTLLLASCFSMMVLAACTTTKLISSEPVGVEIAEVVKPDDWLRITTRDGNQQTLRVVEVTDDRIVGEQQEILLADISMIEQKELTAAGKVGAGVYMITTTVAFYLILWYAIDALLAPHVW